MATGYYRAYGHITYHSLSQGMYPIKMGWIKGLCGVLVCAGAVSGVRAATAGTGGIQQRPTVRLITYHIIVYKALEAPFLKSCYGHFNYYD